MLNANKAHVSGVIGAMGPLLVALGMPTEVAAGALAVIGWLAAYAIPNLRKL